MFDKPENGVPLKNYSPSLFLISLFPSVVGWVFLFSLPLAYLILPRDWERDLFVWVGIPLVPKIVLIGGYAVIFATMLMLIAAAIYLAKKSKNLAAGDSFVGVYAPIVVIGICGVAGFHMLGINHKLLAAILFTLPAVLYGAVRLVRGR